MKTISIQASRPYDVKIGAGLLSTLGVEAARLFSGRTACIVSDETVAALYEPSARASLESAGFTVVCYHFEPGEKSKCGQTFLDLLNFLAQNHLTRSDVLIALGGGVTGDLTGFCASCYLRGVGYIQIPTTLLAMVDSSVGGKTAINLPAGKNLCGAFYQPALVLCDTTLLATLPDCVFVDGCAEVIKYGMLGNRTLLESLAAKDVRLQLEDVVSTCVQMKRQIVQDDEFDTGSRQLLNFGHTLGHAIEAQSQFSISHGQAISVGMVLMTRAAEAFGFCSRQTLDALVTLLQQYQLAVATDQSAQQIYQSALGDKKRDADRLTLVVPTQIGQTVLHQIPVDQLLHWIEAGLEDHVIEAG